MITRKVDREDASPAGFTYGWVKKLGENLDFLYVLTWQKSSRGDLPSNIEIISLRFLKIFTLPWHVLRLLPKIDGVFCHQNPEYTILSFPAKLFGKKIVSWYTHKAVNFRRRLMELLAGTILTASSESFRRPLFRKKVVVTGHGIDVDYFKPGVKEKNEKFQIVSIGRISPAKNYEALIEAIKTLQLAVNFEVKIVGQPVLKKDWQYLDKLKKMASPNVEFVGGISHSQILSYYQNCDLFVNFSKTGSLDKAVLEAMACGKLVLTSNEAFDRILKDSKLIFKSGSWKDIGAKLYKLANLPEEEKKIIGKELRETVVKNHNLNNLAFKILKCYE